VIEIIWGPRFKRTYKKKVKQYPEIEEQLSAALKLYVKDPFHPSLKTHKLGGPVKR
jgi:mRNA-degrading endonuclease YafQ of YafQ-DinJ toxin-antitoxin module